MSTIYRNSKYPGIPWRLVYVVRVTRSIVLLIDMYSLIKFSDQTYYIRKASRPRAIIRSLCAQKNRKKEKTTKTRVEFALQHRNVEYLNLLKRNLERGFPKVNLRNVIRETTIESEAIHGPACHLSGHLSGKSNDGRNDNIENIATTVSQDIAEETRESEAIYGPACHLSGDKSNDERDDNIENIAAVSRDIAEETITSETIHRPVCYPSVDNSNDGRDVDIENIIAAASLDIEETRESETIQGPVYYIHLSPSGDKSNNGRDGGIENIIAAASLEIEEPIEGETIHGPVCHLSGDKGNDGRDGDIGNIIAAASLNIAEETVESESNHGSVYYPSSESDSDSCDDVEDIDENDNYKDTVDINKSNKSNKSNTSLEINKSVEVPAEGVLDDKDLYVATSSSSSKDKKKNCCFFCKTLHTKIARHLETIHSNEPEVKKFSLLPKRCAERLKVIEIIRRKGNFQYNTDSKISKGDLIVCRRPQASKNRNAKDYLPCAKCHGFFSKISIRNHFYQCTGRNSKHTKAVTVLGRAVLGRVHSVASKKLRSVIFPVMREDDVCRVIRYDKLVILYGNKMCVKYKLQHQYDMIRAHLRLLGRFLITMKEGNKNITDFESIYCPKYYEDVINAVNKVAGLDDKVGTYSKPTTAASLGTLLKKVGNLLVTECIKCQDHEKKAVVKDFLELLTEDYGTSVNKTVLETRLQQQRHKNDDLPSMEDIAKLYMYLKCKRQKAFNNLKNEYVYETWKTLAECTLTSVQLFNRRRAGEIERIMIADFEQYKGIDPNTAPDLFKKISSKSQDAAKKYVRFMIRGKLGRTVPVLLNYSLLECIKLILQFRDSAKVPAQNPYIFGLPSYNLKRFKYLRACILMRQFSEDCNAKVAHLLRGTKLRKHIATFCAGMELADTEISDLANFMGHAEKIHRDVYRQPIISRDILNITQHLEAAHGCDSQDTEESSIEECNSDDEEDREGNKETIINEETNDSNSSVDMCQSENVEKSRTKRRSSSPYGRTKRTRWNENEKTVVLTAFDEFMKGGKLPSLQAIHEVIKQNPCLKNRSSPQIKTWLHNQRKKKKQTTQLS
ncbi:uncharacterized protein LOC143899548 isoform X2 [Temnothorax americanus]|uniref:uncharacterized protein LOC143899548 isoform X2 n=1 Tax=Temnothorax americanus TaxID=1964332 RepID=UPI0040695F96